MDMNGASRGDYVEAYWNAHKLCLSYRLPRGKVAHTEGIWLENVTFVVHPRGREKALTTGVMNTHAYMRGTLILASNDLTAPIGDVFVLAKYNPHRYGHFYRTDTLAPVHSAREVIAVGNAIYIAP